MRSFEIASRSSPRLAHTDPVVAADQVPPASPTRRARPSSHSERSQPSRSACPQRAHYREVPSPCAPPRGRNPVRAEGARASARCTEPLFSPTGRTISRPGMHEARLGTPWRASLSTRPPRSQPHRRGPSVRTAIWRGASLTFRPTSMRRAERYPAPGVPPLAIPRLQIRSTSGAPPGAGAVEPRKKGSATEGPTRAIDRGGSTAHHRCPSALRAPAPHPEP